MAGIYTSESRSDAKVNLSPREENSETRARVRILRNIEEIAPIRQIWMDWCENPDAHPDFFLLSSDEGRQVLRPHILVVERNGKPDCILVARLETGVYKMRVGYAAPFQPVVKMLLFPSGAYLGNQSLENSELLVKEICESLRTGEADCAELRQVPFESSLSKQARTGPGFFSRQHAPIQQAHRCLKLPRTFEDYMSGLPRKSRHEARRHARLLQKDFPNASQFQCYTNEAQLDQLMADLKKVHGTTYQGAFGVGFVDVEGTRGRFLAAAKRNALRGCVLYVSDEPVAFFVAFKFRETLFGQYLGFDPRFGKYSLGLQILFHAIEESCDPASGLSVVDLGWGERIYKRAVCNQSWIEGGVFIFAPTWKGLRLNLEKSLAVVLDSKIKKLLVRVGMDRYARKLWQRLAVHNSQSESQKTPQVIGGQNSTVRSLDRSHQPSPP